MVQDKEVMVMLRNREAQVQAQLVRMRYQMSVSPLIYVGTCRTTSSDICSVRGDARASAAFAERARHSLARHCARAPISLRRAGAHDNSADG